MTIAENTPVIIGVGQFAERPGDAAYRALSHMDLAGEALSAAIADCEAGGAVASAIDTIAAIRQFEISIPGVVPPFGASDNPPRSIGKRVGAEPERAILEIVGGQGNQKLVGELAQDIAEGRNQMAAIVGAEAISTVLTLSKRGEKPDWSEEIGGQLENRDVSLRAQFDRPLAANGVRDIIPLYAIFENRRRADLGLSLEEYRQKLGELLAPMSEVAAGNPFAAAPTAYTAEELAAVTERNRIVAEPYPRKTVARDQVNQGAAIIIASAAKARELGIPEERWVHIHAVTNTNEPTILSRPNLASSGRAVASVEAALSAAGIGMDDVRYLDLYSCFGIAVFGITDAFGLSTDDTRGLTLTGGLPFFGGAGNNYSAHAIAEAVQCLRGDPEAYALVNANGGVMHKNAVGIYSLRPADWSSARRYHEVTTDQADVPVLESFDGEGIVESYTLVPGHVSAIIGKTSGGERFVATPADDAATDVLKDGEPFGRTVQVTSSEKGRNYFTFV
ncbi:acetyl-CoA acetyltransferase [Altererythrobacter sp. ZODW24]|uniref:acetyl-CoA acetyltransferase n=1 Tax=Altererythrobacter sp. ZODW24 TaxID=2185142 RepID=UPI000DF76534|nr:acetyl-CoA acetyltransferase [Altererythrobacter sp. ZODW24]